MAGRLDGLVALVTGGGQGIGRAVALEMAKEGAELVVNDLGTNAFGHGTDPTRAPTVVNEILESGGSAIADVGDTGDWDAAASMVNLAIDTFGKLDIVVNAAGIIRLATIFDCTPDDWDAVMRVHLRGYFNTAHHAARHWLRYGPEFDDRRDLRSISPFPPFAQT
jgi:NAD(P)-dependent dehydrogenase (short-subunit alcohol dehydrogenase family)